MGRHPNSTWTPVSVKILMDYLEQEKGAEGLWLVDRQRAYNDVCLLLTQASPQNPPTMKQVKDKLTGWWRRHGIGNEHGSIKDIETFFRQGQQALKPSWNGKQARPDVLTSGSKDRALRPRKSHAEVTGTGIEQSSLTAAAFRTQRQISGNAAGQQDNQSSGPSTPVPTFSGVAVPESVASNADDIDELSLTPKNNQGRSTRVIKVRVPEMPTNTEDQVMNNSPLNPSSQSHILPSDSAATIDGSQPDLAALPTPKSLIGEPKQNGQSMQERYIAEYQRCLAQDPEQFMPSVKMLQKLRADLMEQIQGAVHDLIEASNDDILSPKHARAKHSYEMASDISEALSSKKFFPICQRIYGAGDEQDLLVKSQQSYVSISNFLEVMLASAVQNWVFEGAKVNLSKSIAARTPVSSILESKLHQIGPELHQQLVRESRWEYVNQKEYLNDHVPYLSVEFNSSLQKFFAANNIMPAGGQFSIWLECLNDVFRAALHFRAQVCLLDGDYRFDWPRSDTDFDKKTMRAVEPVNSDQVLRVQMALFPALIQTSIQNGRDGETEKTILYAAVMLK